MIAPDPVEQAMREAQQALVGKGWPNLSEREQGLLVALWQGERIDKVARCLENFTSSYPLFSGSQSVEAQPTRKFVLELAMPTVTGASLMTAIGAVLKLMGVL